MHDDFQNGVDVTDDGSAWTRMADWLVAMAEVEQAEEDVAAVEAQVAEATRIISERDGLEAAVDSEKSLRSFARAARPQVDWPRVTAILDHALRARTVAQRGRRCMPSRRPQGRTRVGARRVRRTSRSRARSPGREPGEPEPDLEAGRAVAR